MSPTVQMRTPSTFARNKGRTVTTISLETSVRKLVPVATQTFLCSFSFVALTRSC